jgi:hypothetical protein
VEPDELVNPGDSAATLNARAGFGWLGRMRQALAFGFSGRDTVVVALAGFLLRGGILLLAVPSAVLPSVIGLAGALGVNAFGIDGRPTTSFIELVVAISAGAAIYLLLATVGGSLVDIWLIEAASDPDDRSPRPEPAAPMFERALSLAGIRTLCLVPLALALAWAGTRIYGSAYNELTTPSSLGVPLAIRTVLGAADAVAVVAVVWLLEETIGAIAVRRLVLTGCGVWRAIGGALSQLVRRPITSVATVLISYMASALVIAAGIAAIATAFDWCRVAARIQQPIPLSLGIGQFSTTRDVRPALFLLAALTLAVAWLAASAFAGIASAWRSAALTGEVDEATSQAANKPSDSRLGLSETPPATSGH